MKFIIYSIIAVLAIVAAVVAFRLSDQGPAQPPVSQAPAVNEINVKTVDVLVARVNVPVGSIIDNSMIDRQPWPENLVLEGFITNEGSGQENIVGKVARSAIQAHEPFMKSKLANPNDPGFLAANLPVGMRAITIATDVVSGIAGFIFPGDRVDLLFTHDNVTNNGGGAGKPAVTEVLGANIRVLAINIRDSNDFNKAAVATPSSITVEVDETMAQQIRLAEKNGSLSFALRSIKDDNSAMAAPTGVGDLSRSSLKPMSVVYGPGKSGGPIKTIYTDGAPANEISDMPGIVRGTPPRLPVPQIAPNAPPVKPATPVNNNRAK